MQTRPEERPPTFESRVHRFIKTDLCQVGPEMLDRVVKFRVRQFSELPKFIDYK